MFPIRFIPGSFARVPEGGHSGSLDFHRLCGEWLMGLGGPLERRHLEGATISVRKSPHSGFRRGDSSSSRGHRDIGESGRRCTCAALPWQAMDHLVSEVFISRFIHLHRCTNCVMHRVVSSLTNCSVYRTDTGRGTLRAAYLRGSSLLQ
jgi:hypothetical protein